MSILGFWGSKLYENDCTCDVRATYIHFLENQYSNEDAYLGTLNAFSVCLGTDEEPLVWYALADTQWSLGRLNLEVKENALYWLRRNGGSNFWADNIRGMDKWSSSMAKLESRITMPQPKEKRIENPLSFQFNPGNIGDIFAYQFHTQNAKRLDCYGKYILFQKIGVKENGKGYLSPHCVFFDEIYDRIPDEVCLERIRILPFDTPERFLPTGRNVEFPMLNMSAIFDLAKKRNSPQKYVVFIGSYPVVNYGSMQVNHRSEFGWDCIEQTLLTYCVEWKQYLYELHANYSVVIPNRLENT